jgi:hypothetical protein
MSEIVSFGSSPSLDNLRLPDNRRLGDLSQGEFYAALSKLGIPNFKHTAGRQDNAAAYAAHLEAISHAAGEVAIAGWMAEKRNV